MRLSIFVRLSLSLLFAGCFTPSYENGLSQCGPNGECPEGFVCAANNRCYQSGALPDLSAADLAMPDLAISCGANMHVCNDGCAFNTDPNTCGVSCTHIELQRWKPGLQVPLQSVLSVALTHAPLHFL